MHHAKSLLHIWPLLPFLLSPGCSDPTETGGLGALGVAGASCLRTPDCQPPLQCIANVCTGLSGNPDASDAPDVSDTTDTALADSNPCQQRSGSGGSWRAAHDVAIVAGELKRS